MRGVRDNCEDIDARLDHASDNWALDRMPVVDRAILRVAVYEMLYVDEVPVSVAINEAVELAKAYGGEDDSSRFVNGVLGRIARAGEGVAEAPNESAGEPEPEPEDSTASEADGLDAEQETLAPELGEEPDYVPEAEGAHE